MKRRMVLWLLPTLLVACGVVAATPILTKQPPTIAPTSAALIQSANRLDPTMEVLRSTVVAQVTALSKTPTPTPWPPRTVGSSSLGLREVWRFHTGWHVFSYPLVPNVFVAGEPVFSYPPVPNLFVAGDKVLFPSIGKCSLLTALSLETGQLIWQTPVPNCWNDGVSPATLDADRIYLMSDFRVLAFDLLTGKLVWETSELEGRTTYYFRPWDSVTPLQLYAGKEKVIEIDPISGVVLKQKPAGELLQYDSVKFTTTADELCAVELSGQDSRRLWCHARVLPPSGQMQLWPSFVDDDVVFQSGFVTYRISRAKVQTGEIIWETERVYFSNFALDNAGRLYAVRQDNVLVILDAKTGRMLDEITFGGPGPNGEWPDWVVVHGPYLLVYFSDTQELIALKLP